MEYKCTKEDTINTGNNIETERESNKNPKSICIFSDINQGVRVIFKEFSFKAI